VPGDENGDNGMNAAKSHKENRQVRRSRAGMVGALIALSVALASCGGTSPAPAAALPAGDEPAATVWKFLDSVETDASGSANSQYLSPALQSEISSGHPLPELLAIQGQYRSFDIEPSRLLEDGQHALVTAGLNYGSPVLRSFLLSRTSGGWQIETLISYSEPLTELSADIRTSSQVVLQYAWDLASGAPDAAWGLLTSDTQALISQDQLSASASEAKQFSITSLALLSELQDRMIYEVRLWVSLNGSSTNWTEGENVRFVDLMNTPAGWRIASMSTQPLS
jgi:hypothetical protein